jgi:hypothetical protein
MKPGMAIRFDTTQTHKTKCPPRLGATAGILAYYFEISNNQGTLFIPATTNEAFRRLEKDVHRGDREEEGPHAPSDHQPVGVSHSAPQSPR